jgi:hypothetical protein
MDQALKKAAGDLSNELSQHLIKRELASYEIGRIIERVYSGKLWKYWPGCAYDTAANWSWGVLHFKERKALYLRSNYLKLSALEVSEPTRLSALRIGWSKLSIVLDMTTSEVQLLEWLDRIERDKLREIDLKKLLAMFRAGVIKGANDVPKDQEPETYSDDDNNNDDGASLEDDESEKAEKTPKMKWALTFTDPDDMKVFVDALEIVRSRLHPGMGLGKAAALMATSYLAHLPRSDEGGVAVEAEYMLQAFERNWGIKVAVEMPSGAADRGMALHGSVTDFLKF